MTSRAKQPVNGFGFYFETTTWARHARAFFTALHRVRTVTMFPLDTSQRPARLGAEEAALLGASTAAIDAARTGIGVGPIECMTSVQGSKRIAFVVWETTLLPEEKCAVLREMDAIWTPSEWSRRVLIENGMESARVFVVPEGVDTAAFRPLPEVRRQNTTFRFLCVGKWEVRKGVEDLVECFAEEFDAREDVELVLHGFNPWLPDFDLEDRIAGALRGRKARIVASPPVCEDELCALYAGCDAFVLPTKGEGWGLPIMEAMACGLPVIATDYSAQTDYLDQRVAYPLRVERMIEVHDPYFFPEAGTYGQWAQPNLKELRRLMRHVATNQDEAAAKGRLAREAVCSRWTWDHAARIADGLLSQA